jgi:hypothetical protein
MQAGRAAAADEHHQRGRAARVEGEVVGAAGAERGVHGEAGLAQPGPARGCQRVVVDQRGLALVDPHAAGAAVGQAGVPNDLAQRRAHGRPVGRVKRAERAARGGARRDHVGRLPGLERPHRDHGAVRGVGAPADDLLQGEDRLAQRGHRVGGQVRVPGVPGGAVHPDLEIVGRGVHGAGRGCDRARRQLVLQVHPDDGTRLLRGECRRGRNVPRPRRHGLLAGLEHGEQRRRQHDRTCRPAERRERGHVHVMAAGVHRTAARSPGHAGLLRHRKGIKLGPDRDARAALRAYPHDPPGAGDGRRVAGAQCRCEPGRRAVLRPGQLGVRVQVVPEPDSFAELPGQPGAQRRRQARAGHGPASWYTRSALAEPTRCATRSASAADHAPSATNRAVTLARSRRKPMAPR